MSFGPLGPGAYSTRALKPADKLAKVIAQRERLLAAIHDHESTGSDTPLYQIAQEVEDEGFEL